MNTVFVASSEMMAVDERKMFFGKSSSSGFNDYSYKRVYRLGVNRWKYINTIYSVDRERIVILVRHHYYDMVYFTVAEILHGRIQN